MATLSVYIGMPTTNIVVTNIVVFIVTSGVLTRRPDREKTSLCGKIKDTRKFLGSYHTMQGHIMLGNKHIQVAS